MSDSEDSDCEHGDWDSHCFRGQEIATNWGSLSRESSRPASPKTPTPETVQTKAANVAAATAAAAKVQAVYATLAKHSAASVIVATKAVHESRR